MTAKEREGKMNNNNDNMIRGNSWRKNIEFFHHLKEMEEMMMMLMNNNKNR